MVKAFDMLFEYDSGYVVDGYKVPMSYELGSFEEFSIYTNNQRANL